MKKTLCQEKGVVLLLVLTVVALLASLLTEFAFSTLVDLRLTETYRDSTKAYYLAKGGIRVGRVLLQEDTNGYDATGDPEEMWSQGIANYPVGDGAVSIAIEDLGGKLAINGLVSGDEARNVIKTRFILFFENLGLDAPEDLTAALIDWLDSGDDIYDISGYGAEDEYYLRLENPYPCKNGPLDTLNELALVRGFTPEVMKAVTPHLSAHGSDTVNVNTATAEVLMSLDKEMDSIDAEKIISVRNAEPLKNGQDKTELKNLLIKPALQTVVNSYLSLQSEFFHIRSQAWVNDGTRTLEAVVKNETNNTTKLLYLKVN